MASTYVHPRVIKRHPELTEKDVLSAWHNAFAMAIRTTPEGDRFVAAGADAHGRLVEMVAVKNHEGYLIFHAMTPPSARTLIELNLQGR